MAMFKTLADLKAKTEKPVRAEGEFTQRYFTIKDKESYKIRFRQELTEDSANYDEQAGVAHIIQVHSNPADFQKQARCTADMEEYGYKCWACTQVPLDRAWRAKNHLVVNVAVFNAEEKTWEPRVLDHKFTAAHVAESLLEFASEYGTIVDREYKISRKGEKQQTQYTLVPMTPKDADKAIAELPFHDVTKTYRVFSPAEQEGFYSSSEEKGGSQAWE